MEEHNGIKFGIFGFIVLIIIVGGFVLMRKSFNIDARENDNMVEEKANRKDIRLDKDKDYIYFTDYEVYEEELDIAFSKIHINFKDSNNIAKLLNDETASFKLGIKKENDAADAPYEKLSYAKYYKYEMYTYGDYISLVIKYFVYTPENFISFDSAKAFVFDLNDGSLVSSDDLMKKYNITKETINAKISEFVTGQNLLKEGEHLDVNATVSINSNNLILYIDRIGKLNASILVKSDKKDYNDSVILN